MPIFLPPLNRRKFLIRSLAASAGLAIAPRLFGKVIQAKADSWALLADAHIAADKTAVSRGVNMAEHLAAVVQEVIALSDQPAGLFVIGDCAYGSGENGDYTALTKLMEPVRKAGVPICLGLGNHDNRERFWGVLREESVSKRPLADKHVALVKSPQVNWFLLDSLDTTLAVPGLLGAQQLDWLGRTLDENKDKPAVIMIHHQPDQTSSVSGIRDTEALFAVIRPRKQVKAYIFGHTHDWNVAKDESGIHLINLPPVAYVFTEGKPSGWVYATLEKNGMRLKLRCIDPNHAAHGQMTSLEWRS